VDALVTGHFEVLLQHPEHCGSHIHRTLEEDPNITPARCVTVAAVEHSPPAGGTAPVHLLLAEAELFRRDETRRDSQACWGPRLEVIAGSSGLRREALRLAAHETKRAFKSAELAPFELRSTDIGPAHLAPSTRDSRP
jgi:hypothetical protein